ncbi:sensor domain-containing protein [Celerinatantimonas diazotrophica]|uniref:cyclic-guanylate-specific phosphodiesterase n=1 Tax=Celerinatantimonas diazotrophica TaxID=412034 RepID=A0A4R1J9X0_9GAMM|nr:EAL domain-containing protein [Celerinatantimonas diazotrophica]TCK47234.1 PAS domain S-box-containing protein/diguanylate cyclase (GGDEF)-like protein [Celerinatantimonas diazotrophica]CAG9296006.1 hypothetical protein CEDIAZO_01145 [Celerinatantimonas diazotrophica]
MLLLNHESIAMVNNNQRLNLSCDLDLYQAKTYLADGLANQASDCFFPQFCQLLAKLIDCHSVGVFCIENRKARNKTLRNIGYASTVDVSKQACLIGEPIPLTDTPFVSYPAFVQHVVTRYSTFAQLFVPSIDSVWSMPFFDAGQVVGYVSCQFNQLPKSADFLEQLLASFNSRIVYEFKLYEKNLLPHLVDLAFQHREGIVITDSQFNIVQVNEAFCHISGYRKEQLLTRSIDQFLPGLRAVYLRQPERKSTEYIRQRPNGQTYLQHEEIIAIEPSESQNKYYVIHCQSITHKQTPDDQIYKLAYCDELTGLVNRRKLLFDVDQAFRAAQGHARIGALLFIDLDHFKNINDSLGHSVGDWILQQVANRLRFIVRDSDILARLGGDEFVVLLSDLGDNPAAAEPQAAIVGKRIIEDISKPYLYHQQLLHLGASVGVSLFPGRGQSADDLLRQADTAMYQAKSAGRKALRFFEKGMQREADQRLRVYNQLREALSENQLRLYYQPQHLLKTGELMGAEALVRWQPPGKMLVGPHSFIHIAEESELIWDIGCWVLQEACKTFVKWQSEGLRLPEISVNISARQFAQEEFVDFITEVLDKTGMDAGYLNLEITESMLVSHVETTISKMNELKKLGIRFSIDDFGAGYSSLAYLKRLPVDELKVDRSFVRDIPHDRRNMAIVETIIAMAQHLGFSVTAEGVETHQQRDFLTHRGCLFYQGFLVSKPLSAEAMRHYMQEHLQRKLLRS